MRVVPLSSAALGLGGAAVFVDLFLRWASRSFGPLPGATLSGWDIQHSGLVGLLAASLALVEVASAASLWRSRTSALLGFFLGAGTAVSLLMLLARLRWGLFFDVRFGSWAYGAWIAVALAAIVLAGTVLRAGELRPAVAGTGGTRPDTASE